MKKENGGMGRGKGRGKRVGGKVESVEFIRLISCKVEKAIGKSSRPKKIMEIHRVKNIFCNQRKFSTENKFTGEKSYDNL